MGCAVYNSDILLMVNPPLRPACGSRAVLQICFLIVGFAAGAWAADWNGSEQQLAMKIIAVTGPGAVAWTVENRSTLGRRDVDVITNGLRADLESAGARYVKPEEA